MLQMNLIVTHMFCLSVEYSDIGFVTSVSCIDTPIKSAWRIYILHLLTHILSTVSMYGGKHVRHTWIQWLRFKNDMYESLLIRIIMLTPRHYSDNFVFLNFQIYIGFH